MAKKYDPNKKMRKIWKLCENPLSLTILMEKDNGRYLLADQSKLYGRIMDINEGAIYAPTYVYYITMFDPTPVWKKYEGSQDKITELLESIGIIWYTDKESKDFKIEDYKK